MWNASPLSLPGGLRPLRLLLFLPWLALLGWLADHAWFLVDDAFISFRYARNLLEGHGLVFNPGERVEGYSNFLWVLELAALWGAFGLRPEHAAPWLSVAFTAATLAAMLWWATRLPSLALRVLTGWMALGLVCSSATFATWTSAGGLETRQFTFFVVLSVVCLSLHRDRRRMLLLASCSLAAASLTRPEGPLFAACCFAWYALQRRADTGRWMPEWGAAACLVAPCALAVAAHYLFRYGYYGEWLPNTYYAKHLGPWYEMGVRYLGAAARETGLYLLLPLALVALATGWRQNRSLAHALPLLCVVLHMAYVARVGGDHFEWRPLDPYWPLLAVPAAAGIVHVGLMASRGLRRLVPFASRHPLATARGCAVALFLPVLLYSNAMQAAFLFNVARISPLAGESDEESAGLLAGVPGMPALVDMANDANELMGKAGVSARVQFVGRMTARWVRQWHTYEDVRGIIPDDAVMLEYVAGVVPYYLPDLEVVDGHGLADATVARSPVPSDRRRRMAHDRRPPPGYLAKRGVNFTVYAPAASLEEALQRATYAAPFGPDLWMPFDAPDPEWVEARFETFSYDAEADARLEQALDGARHLLGARFDVWLDGRRLLYVKDRCAFVENAFFLHVVPADPEDLPEERKKYGYDNLDFQVFGGDRRRFAPAKRLKVAHRCVVARPLPDYTIGAIRTGQTAPMPNGEFKVLWSGEHGFSADGTSDG